MTLAVGRHMHLFISAGEPSGDLHGANLIRALKARHPGIRITGFGGPRMEAVGADLLYRLTDLAVMWFGQVFANILTFFRLARRARRHFETDRPDAVVLIDYPGFHFALAKRAHAAGIPVYFFVPPQLWGWAGWRVKKVRRWFDGVLTALPFEEKWYRERGVNTHYVGHPYYDELAVQPLDAKFLGEYRGKGGPVVALLPGSRNQEVAKNFSDMLSAARQIHAARPDVRFLVASFNARQAEAVRETAKEASLPIEIHVGRTPEIIELADCCVAVSGSVSLEMMYRLKPAVITYRGGLFLRIASWALMTVKYITLVNLLANEEVYPEFGTYRDRSDDIASHILTWLNDPAARAGRVDRLRQLREEVARPGACARAADFLLETVRLRAGARTAA
ncbi:MAG: lpxB [Gemmataceae bacterium]|nr:lpxB [Gemmataceae bacterium]